jgi:hypothetical protein
VVAIASSYAAIFTAHGGVTTRNAQLVAPIVALMRFEIASALISLRFQAVASFTPKSGHH